MAVTKYERIFEKLTESVRTVGMQTTGKPGRLVAISKMEPVEYEQTYRMLFSGSRASPVGFLISYQCCWIDWTTHFPSQDRVT